MDSILKEMRNHWRALRQTIKFLINHVKEFGLCPENYRDPTKDFKAGELSGLEPHFSKLTWSVGKVTASAKRPARGRHCGDGMSE